MTENSIIELNKVSVPQNIEVIPREGANSEIVNWGVDNNYPSFLFNLYTGSADHQSIIDGMIMYIKGKGLTTTNPQLSLFFKSVNEDENINDVFHKIISDYLIYGGFAIHIIPNKLKQISKVYHVDFSLLRTDEKEDKIYFADKWKRYRTTDIREFKSFKRKNLNSETIFYFKGLKTRGVYPIPLYNGAILSIMTDIEIAKFHYNNVSNGFQPSTIINFNNGETDDTKKDKIEKKIKEKFEGTEASKMLISFNQNKESAVTVEKLNADNFDEQFKTLKKDVQNTIFTSHKVTSPALFGIKMENTGFSKTEYKEAFEIFNQIIIKSHQNVIENELYKLFKEYINLNLSEIKTIPFELKKESEVLND